MNSGEEINQDINQDTLKTFLSVDKVLTVAVLSAAGN